MTELQEREAAEPRISRRAFTKGTAASLAVSALVGPGLAGAKTPVRPRRPLGGRLPDVPLYDLEISEAAPFLHDRSLSPVDLVEAFLERSEAVESQVLAFVHPYSADEVRAQARAAEREIRRGRYRGPLHE